MPTINTNTHSPEARLDQALAGLSVAKLRTRLITGYLSLKRNFSEGRFEAAGLDAGKFCEVALRIAQSQVTGTYVPLGTRIPNFADSVRALVVSPSTAAPESIREIIPRALLFLYTLRNKRGIGHVAGDVDANRVDATTILHGADWVICELVRLYHGLSLEEAQTLIDSLVQRRLPAVWEVNGLRRVLTKGLTSADETLLLLYSASESAILAEDLCGWVEYSELRHYRKNVLRPLHVNRMIEFDGENDAVHLSPLGIQRVENDLLRLAG